MLQFALMIFTLIVKLLWLLQLALCFAYPLPLSRAQVNIRNNN